MYIEIKSRNSFVFHPSKMDYLSLKEFTNICMISVSGKVHFFPGYFYEKVRTAMAKQEPWYHGFENGDSIGCYIYCS